jgi:hypothetical protein
MLILQSSGGNTVRSIMSFQAKRELLAQVAPRYQEANHTQKSLILDEFVAATGYARKYAIRLLTRPPVAPAAAIRRPRARHYGPAVLDALCTAWAASNYIGSRRLAPFLEELVPILERHGHLTLSQDVRTQLVAISAPTIDRLLRPLRLGDHPHGMSTTKPGTLLKHQVPVRTFADWNAVQPGFFEVDTVAHCGWSTEGTFLHTLVLTDVATGWTECLALLHRSQHAVVQALDRARQLLPFAVLGLDTDNGGEFVGAELLGYCEREQLTFTRSRAYKQNDQCYVEQKNGAIVRQFVGYDRFEGQRVYRQLTELYRALRLSINFFQPSMKLKAKRREGSTVKRTYDTAQTPYQRLCAAGVLAPEARQRLDAIYQALDPVRLLQQITALQDALWPQAVFRTPAPPSTAAPEEPADVRFRASACGLGADATTVAGHTAASEAPGVAALPTREQRPKRKYHRRQKIQGPRWWRTRKDPFAAVWEEVTQWVAVHPERTAKAVFVELQQRDPGQFPDVQLRTLQRRVQAWRAQTILTFDDHWLQEDVLVDQVIPRPLRAIHESDAIWSDPNADEQRQSVPAHAPAFPGTL